jgi:hypothetical protein
MPESPTPPVILALDRNNAELVWSTKICSGAGLDTLHRWLQTADSEVLLLSDGGAKTMPIVLLRWDSWATRFAKMVIRGGSRRIIADAQPAGSSIIARNR